MNVDRQYFKSTAEFDMNISGAPRCGRFVAIIVLLWAFPALIESRAAACDAPANGALSSDESTPTAVPLRRRRWIGRLVARRPLRTGAAVRTAEPPAEPAEKWQTLFDGKSLTGWSVPQFGGEGDVAVENGSVVLAMGEMLTGITLQGEVPTSRYEISLEAMRVEGIDFFCGLTFPVDRSHCSLIVGGWAGAVVGLSSIDRRDASENETTRYMKFETLRWYRIRLRVTAERIVAWIDDEKVVDQNIVGRHISTRNEVDLSQPLGIAAWQTTAALRNIKLRALPRQ